MSVAIAFLCGLLFGGGLWLSGMADPANVLGFLDVAGHWNPILAGVMGGAVAITLPGFWLLRRKGRDAAGQPLHWPRRWPPDGRLVAGSVLFGVGWGLSGVCPGPALVLLGLDGAKAATLVACIALGWLGTRWVSARRIRALGPQTPH
ncbi:MAG: DUF6691 family protein [Acetobacter sp.]